MKGKNEILELSLEFAIRIVHLYQYLCNEKKEFILSKQLLKSGTSVGANVREAMYAQSRNDFIAKMSISLKEISETEYWLELLHRTNILDQRQYQSMNEDCTRITRILISIVKTSKNNR